MDFLQEFHEQGRSRESSGEGIGGLRGDWGGGGRNRSGQGARRSRAEKSWSSNSPPPLAPAPVLATAKSSTPEFTTLLNIRELQAIFCVRGRELLYKYCSEHEVPHKQIGKLIVATRSSEVPKLNDLMIRGNENGVDGLRMLEGFEAMEMEPELQCVRALLSPASGIVDTHSLMLSLVGEAENHRTTFCYNTAVLVAILKEIAFAFIFLKARILKTGTGGLSAPALAKRFDGLNSTVIPASHYARGCYFVLSKMKTPPFKHLIYPIPEDGGLGVHVTLDLDGQIKFGPDVEWINGVDDISSFLNKFDYSVCAKRVERFYPEIRKYYPNLKDDSLEPGYAGIRPKLSGAQQSAVDFVIQVVSANSSNACHLSWNVVMHDLPLNQMSKIHHSLSSIEFLFQACRNTQ
ncbi:L-2-hydroxyglutarate dehydrogenase, mitochondrial [Vitis vinifera]|uniref:L-2-hydroxyglutarate dehydrogenase, mitochondrial n=1 Tax=Vitis vinifera TaxID=29760 RepID=A0A438BY10_VITVI|nr:L-2-hydroxyglutarate dehydrogenase, mitochondrial [Vitis vinifera]